MGKKGSGRRRKQAASADRHTLYELAVQCPEAEVDFVDATFRSLRGRKPQVLREDFCGTGNVCCEWVRRGGKRRAIGVDLDTEVLAWGRENQIGRLSRSQQRRVSLIAADVMSARTESPDVVSAMNFSYWLLQDRKTLKKYFRRVHRSLQPDGIFFLDAYGGYDSHHEIVEEREIDDGGDGFTYIWEQVAFNPITHTMACRIHFAFPDGSRLDDAFSYEWRLWTLPEIRDLLHESGFARTTVYWQGWDADGEPDGDFRPATDADADAGWICYISAEK